MAGVYTIRLAAVRQGPANVSNKVFTHPGSGVIVVRALVISNVGGAAGYCQLQVGTDAGPRATLFIHNAIEIARTIPLETRQVVEPGEGIWLVTNGSELSVLVTGYHLNA